MLGTRHVCQSCGETLLVPYYAPKNSFEMSKEGLRQFLASGDFEREGRDFTVSERHALKELAANCPCGGPRLRDDDPGDVSHEEGVDEGAGSNLHRCPACGSRNLDLEVEVEYD